MFLWKDAYVAYGVEKRGGNPVFLKTIFSDTINFFNKKSW